jgi:uncharacterized protein (UPF0548 family)
MGRASKAITLRLDPAQFGRIAAIAKAENRTPTNYVETVVLRDLASKEEAGRVITIFAAPETAGMAYGALQRGTDESDERYAQRKALFNELMSIPDEGSGEPS